MGIGLSDINLSRKKAKEALLNPLSKFLKLVINLYLNELRFGMPYGSWYWYLMLPPGWDLI